MTLPKFTVDARVLDQKKIIEGVYCLTVKAPEIAKEAQPGQFVQLRVLNRDVLLRRPVGIAEVGQDGSLSFIYRVVGKGTKYLSQLKKGDVVNVMGPLGHGFNTNVNKALLVGGGMGLSPLLFCAQAMDDRVDVLMGGKTADELFWLDFFADYAENTYMTTDDGSMGVKGFTVDLLPELLKNKAYDLIIVCGPEIMMRKVAEIAEKNGIPCQVSLEKRMACGLGACLSCSVDTVAGRRKVCKDGPVFWAKEVFPHDR